jgi:hypothetical protein
MKQHSLIRRKVTDSKPPTSKAFSPVSFNTASLITLLSTSVSKSRIPTSCGPVYGGSGEVMGVKLNTKMEKRVTAEP